MTYWDTQATRWGVFSVPDEDYDKYTARQAAFIVEQLAIDKGLALDVGCGIGRLTKPVAEALPDANTWGFDPSEAMIQKAWANVPWASPEFYFTSEARLNESFSADELDGAWCVLTFQHLGEVPTREILRDVAGALKPGGRFVTQWMLDKDQAFPREADVLRLLEDEGYENVHWVDDADVTKLWFADNWLWVTSERTP